MKKILLFTMILIFGLSAAIAQDLTNVENYRIYKMSEFLDLTPEQAEIFFPLLRQYEKEIGQISEKENQLYESIKERAKKDQINEQELKQLMEQVRDFGNQRDQLKQHFMQQSGRVLSPGQVMRMQFFEKEFRKDLKREFIQRQANPNAGGKNNPGKRPGTNPGNSGNPGNNNPPGGRP
jgi:Spy/CpxP family protein refolding chaperone